MKKRRTNHYQVRAILGYFRGVNNHSDWFSGYYDIFNSWRY